VVGWLPGAERAHVLNAASALAEDGARDSLGVERSKDSEQSHLVRAKAAMLRLSPVLDY
jgi:hypothetical protein